MPQASEELYADKVNHLIQLYPTGTWFDIKKPEFYIQDIAHGLAMSCRFNGHVRTFYSVADHSIMVSKLMGGSLEGLLHDVPEYVLSDVASPLKQLLPDWKKLDKNLDAAMRWHWNLPPEKSEACHHADWVALFVEAIQLTPDAGRGFFDPGNYREEAHQLIKDKPSDFTIYKATDPETSFMKFMVEFIKLTSKED